MKREYKGHSIKTFQQFPGAWLAQYSGPLGRAQLPGFTERRAVAKCKAEILHYSRTERIDADEDYFSRIRWRLQRSKRPMPNYTARRERQMSVAV